VWVRFPPPAYQSIVYRLASSKSFPWYTAYNQTKRDRHKAFGRANLQQRCRVWLGRASNRAILDARI
jgi:hypothetical protein